MKIKFIDGCVDKYTGESYKKEQEKEFDEARALEIVGTGYAIVIEEEKKIDLEELSKKELVALAKSKGLPHSGTKEEIINRLCFMA